MAAISFSYGCFSGFISRICLPENCMTVVVRILSPEVFGVAGQPVYGALFKVGGGWCEKTWEVKPVSFCRLCERPGGARPLTALPRRCGLLSGCRTDVAAVDRVIGDARSGTAAGAGEGRITTSDQRPYAGSSVIFARLRCRARDDRHDLHVRRAEGVATDTAGTRHTARCRGCVPYVLPKERRWQWR